MIDFARAERVVALYLSGRLGFVAMLANPHLALPLVAYAKPTISLPSKKRRGYRGGHKKIERKFYGFMVGAFFANLRKIVTIEI